MRRVLTVTALIILSCAACATVEKTPADVRLVEAQQAFDEGQKLKKAERYAEALPHVERALELREALLGGMHPEVARCLHLLGDLHQLKGDHARAEPLPLYERALAIQEAALGKDHPDVAAVLHSLAYLYYSQENFSRAEPLYERTLAIWEATLGENHPHVAVVLNNLAYLYYSQENFSRAESLSERALAILEATLGKNHLHVARTLNLLALLYHSHGNYSRSEQLYERALAIYEAALGKHHPDISAVLHNLASLCYSQGNYSRSEQLHERALAIYEATLGKHHPDIAKTLNNLAYLYWKQGNYTRAEPLYKRALAIYEATPGKNHGGITKTLHNLALLYLFQGDYTRAEPLYERSLEITEATLGQNHLDVAGALYGLAWFRLAQQRLAEALPLLARAFISSEQHLRREVFGLSEARLASALHYLRADEERLYTLIRTHSDDTRVRHLALSAALLRKGRSVEEISDTSRIIYRGLGPSDREQFERLRALRTQLSTLSLAGPGQLSPTDYQQRLKELADQGDALEVDLARRSEPLRSLSELPSPDEIVDRVAQALPSDGALIEFVAYNDSPLAPKPNPPSSRNPSELRYLVLLLFPDGRTRALDLGPTAPIDRAALRFHDALANRSTAHQTAAQELHALVFRPLVPLLGQVRRLFLSPDGQLALVPFSALHDGRRFLLDTFDITYLTSGKDLLPRPSDILPAHSVVVLADPEFNSTPATPSLALETASAERSASLERFFSNLRSDLLDQSWSRLPGTRKEAEAIQRLLPRAQLLLGPAATKDALLKLPTPGLLHIATHGFFLKDASAQKDTRALGNIGAIASGPPRDLPDPLLRSGLVLADAHGPSTHPDSPTLQDFLITALELAGLNLWGTQLVVLSACETGRGDIKLGQGVYGLRRALVVAGAETLVTSLWKVNDDTTRELMEDYYRNLLSGQGRAAALRQTMRALRLKQPHPYFWAPFIAIGRDSPLQGMTPPTVAKSP